MIYKEEEIVVAIGEYFEKLFSTCPGERADTMRRALHPIITAVDNEILLSLPSASEIKEAALFIHADKAPGPDDFLRDFPHTLV